MRHPTEGTLRRLVDEPAGVADTDRQHVAGCPACLSALAAVRQDAELVGAALSAGPPPEVDAGWRRLAATAATDGAEVEDARPAPAASRRGLRRSAVAGTGSRRRRAGLRSPAVAALGVATVLAGASVAAAADWLPIFRTEQIASIELTKADLVQLPDLSSYGRVRITERPEVREVADGAAAAEATGLTVPRVGELPTGVTGEPTFQVGKRVSATFTYSAEEAARVAADVGEPLPPAPPGMEGSQFRLTAGPGMAAVWTEARGVPALLVARAVAPTAYSSGVPFPVARDYLLSLPGLPDAVAGQLRSFSEDGTTLPLPVPADLVDTSTADVGGVQATVLAGKDGSVAGVVWVSDGVVTAVAGSLSTDEVLSVARGLR